MTPPAETRPRAIPPWLWSEPAVAVLTWVVLSTIAVGIVRVVDLNPLTTRGEIMPMAFGAVVGAGLLALAFRSRSALLPPIIAGAFAAWVLFVLAQSYQGTPFGDSGLRGDTGRLTAAVTRYTSTWKPVDAFVPSIPIEYPPLFPYLLGHLANVIGRPGWAIVGDAMAVTMSLAVLSSFLLWRRLVSSYAAVVLAVIPVYAFTQPRKAYEVLALAVFVPWVLSTLTRFRQPGGLHWLPAGILLGLMAQLYFGFLLYDVLGIAALALIGWLRAEQRGAYLRHVALTLGLGIVLCAWYIGPYLYFVLFRGYERVADYAILAGLPADPLGVLPFTSNVLGLVQVFGLLGLIALRRRHWWAEPMLIMVAGAFAYRWIYLLGFSANGHTGFLYYTTNLIDELLYSAAVLTVWAVLPTLAARVHPEQVRQVATALAAIFMAIVMFTGWQVWMPSPVGVADTVPHGTVGSPNLALDAHAEHLPSGALPRYAAPKEVKDSRWFPVPRIQDAVRYRFGPDARPVTLSYDERLFSYLPWPAYMSVERVSSNSLMKWDSRFAEVKRLSAIKDPIEFTEATKATKFGRIDVFVLHVHRGYTFLGVPFRVEQFAGAWDFIRLPNETVVAVRIAGPS